MDLARLIFKFIVSFAIPFCWLFLLYPLFKKLNKAWYFLLVPATILSVLLLIFKEMMDDRILLLNDITAYSLGLFFGSSMLAFIFERGSFWMKATPRGETYFTFLDGVTLQNILQVGVVIEEEGIEFYKTLAENSVDTKTKDLCIRLLVSEIKHRKILKDWLSRWLPPPISTEKTTDLISEARKRGIFLDLPKKDSSEEDMVKFALLQEGKMEGFYRSFEDAFPDAWERMQIQKLAVEERAHARTLLDSYPDLKLS